MKFSLKRKNPSFDCRGSCPERLQEKEYEYDIDAESGSVSKLEKD